MDLFEAHRKGFPLVAETEEGGARLLAEIFQIPGGVAFADTGWPNATSHAFHVLRGQVKDDDSGWRIGSTLIRSAFYGERLQAEHVDWLVMKEVLGPRATRDACWAEIERSGILESSAA